MSLSNVAVVILNWNGKKFLEKFLPTVIKHSQLASIYLADNLSTDDSVNYVLENFPTVKIIQNQDNRGYAEGYNQALKQVREEYYVLLNSDVEVTENWIEPIITLMSERKEIAACQPKILDFYQRDRFEYAGACGGYIDKYAYPFCRGRIFNELEKDEHQYDDVKEVFWATGACMFVRASAFWEIQGFDSDYFAHMEEIDLCWRLKNIGYSIFVQPRSVVYHVGGGTLNKLSPKKTFLNFRNNLITLTKNSAPKVLPLKILYRLILDGIAGMKFLLEGNGSHFIAVIKAHFAFYACLPSTLQKRKAMRELSKFKYATTGVLTKNIVFAHFIKGIKKYSAIS